MSLFTNFLLSLSLCLLLVSATYPKCYSFSWNLPTGKAALVYQNFGNCTCKQARQDELAHKDLCTFIPQCNKDGTFISRQTDMNNVFCVDKNGNQITEAVVTGKPSDVHCKQ